MKRIFLRFPSRYICKRDFIIVMLLIFILCFIRFEVTRGDVNDIVPPVKQPLKSLQNSDNAQKMDNISNLKSAVNINNSVLNDTSSVTLITTESLTILKKTTPESLMKEMLTIKKYSKLCGGSDNENLKVDFTFVNKNNDVDCDKKSFLLFAVLSHISHFENRERIRQSWASLRQLQNRKLTVIFFIYSDQLITKEQTKSMEKERNEYLDTVWIENKKNQRTDVDIYIKIFQFLIFGCNKPDYFVFVNDSMFVNIPTLLDAILTHRDISKSVSHENSLFLCKVKKNGMVMRNRKSFWFVTTKEWPDKHYPPHCDLFHGMLMSANVLRDMLMCSFYAKKFWIADVFLTGIVTQKLDITVEDFLEDFSTNSMKNHYIAGDMSHNLFLTDGLGYNDHTWRLIFNRSLREL